MTPTRGSGQDVFQISRVGLGRARADSVGAGSVGSGRVRMFFRSQGSGWVGSGLVRVGSGAFQSYQGSGPVTVTRPDPTQPDPTREV